MIETIQGTIQAVSAKGPVKGAHGSFYNIGLKVGDLWYNKTSNIKEPVTVGQEVSISFETSINAAGNESRKIIPKGLNLLDGAVSEVVSTKQTSTQETKKVGTTTAKFATDDRQESIVFQNALAHATRLAIHNAGNNSVNLETVLELAYRIASVSIKPSLGSQSKTVDDVSSERTLVSATKTKVPKGIFSE